MRFIMLTTQWLRQLLLVSLKFIMDDAASHAEAVILHWFFAWLDHFYPCGVWPGAGLTAHLFGQAPS